MNRSAGWFYCLFATDGYRCIQMANAGIVASDAWVGRRHDTLSRASLLEGGRPAVVSAWAITFATQRPRGR